MKKSFFSYPANIYLFKVNSRNTKKRYEICSKFTITTPKRPDPKKIYAENMEPPLFGCIKAGNKTAIAVVNYNCFE